ncbi:MAG: sugar-binding protein [Oscillospiraceae bacterium]|nr:sugar-binding protein [Oscillospiraceae bacterium]
MKKFLSLMLLFALSLSVFASCTSKTSGVKVGVSMPNNSSQAGSNIKKIFEERDYVVDLQYAQDISTQASQLENMIGAGCKVLIIEAINSQSLKVVLQKAKDNNVKVIAYDILIRDSSNISYYVTFDNYKVGVLQAQSLETALGLKNGKGPFNIELFGGSLDDNNAYFFYDGAMGILQPYLDSGKLVVKSGQTAIDKIATSGSNGAAAQSRMENILTTFYANDRVDAILSPYDDISIGVLNAVKDLGYGTSDKPIPFVSGQDAEIASVKSIIAGEQYSTVFKDTRILSEKCLEIVNAILLGRTSSINDTKTHENGAIAVPSYLCTPIIVDKTNYKEVLIDSGYYTEAELQKSA